MMPHNPAQDPPNQEKNHEVSRTNILCMVFKLAKNAESRWLRLRGTEQMAKLMYGVQFKIGSETPKENHQEIVA